MIKKFASSVNLSSQIVPSSSSAPSSSVAGPSAPSLTESAEMTGWLTKLGGHGMGRNWKKRYFVLNAAESSLYYFKSQNDEAPAGMIYLPDFTHIEVDTGCKKSSFCWMLSSRVTGDSISAPVCVVGVEPIVMEKVAGDINNSDSAVDLAAASAILQQDKNADKANSDDTEEAGQNVDEAKEEPKSPRTTRTYYAYAATEAEMNDWIVKIKPFLAGGGNKPTAPLLNPVANADGSVVVASDFEQSNDSAPSTLPNTPRSSVILTQPPPTPAPSVDIGPAPPTPPTDTPITGASLMAEIVELEEMVTAAPVAVEEEQVASAEEEDESSDTTLIRKSSRATAATKVGYKVSSLYTKMADLDILMGDLESKSKEDLRVVHDSLRMAYAMLQKELLVLKELGSQVSPPPSPVDGGDSAHSSLSN